MNALFNESSKGLTDTGALSTPVSPHSPSILLKVVITGITVAVLYLNILYPAFISPLSKIPTPHWSCHVSPLWLLWARATGNENKATYRTHLRRGPVVRLAPNELSFNCYEGGLKEIYLGHLPRTEFYSLGFDAYGKGNLFTMTNTAQHDARKRLFSKLFSKSNIMSSPSLRAVTDTVILDKLLPLLQDRVERAEPVSALDLGYGYSMDVIANWAFGLSLGSNFLQDDQEREQFLTGWFSRTAYMFQATEIPTITQIFRMLGVRLIPRSTDVTVQEVEKWTIDKCDQAASTVREQTHVALVDEPVVMAQALATMSELGEKRAGKDVFANYPGRLDIASEMYTFVTAAFETSGNTFAYMFYELSRRPLTQARLRAEILTVSESISQSDLPFTKDIDALPFLDAVIKETLRLYSTVPGPQQRRTPRPILLGGKHHVPGGTIVHCSAYTVHRNSSVFPDPEKWSPERWLDVSPAELNQMRKWFWAFGSGASMCPGIHFAMMSMKIALVAIYSRFTTTVHETGDMELEDAFLGGPKGKKVLINFDSL